MSIFVTYDHVDGAVAPDHLRCAVPSMWVPDSIGRCIVLNALVCLSALRLKPEETLRGACVGR